MPVKLSREMGLTPSEFLRTLSSALGDNKYKVTNLDVLIEKGQGEVTIRLHPLAPRRLGRLTLPVTRVEFSFSSIGSVEIEAFMSRLERYFQRGGG